MENRLENKAEDIIRMLKSASRSARNRNFSGTLEALDLVSKYLELYNLPVDSEKFYVLGNHFLDLSIDLSLSNLHAEAEKSKRLGNYYLGKAAKETSYGLTEPGHYGQ